MALARTPHVLTRYLQARATLLSGGQAISGWLSKMNRSRVDPERAVLRTKIGARQVPPGVLVSGMGNTVIDEPSRGPDVRVTT
jgi:hypothetical protein